MSLSLTCSKIRKEFQINRYLTLALFNTFNVYEITT